MLEAIIIILLVLWLLGMVSGQSLGGMLWMLLVVAAVLFVVRLLTGRRTVCIVSPVVILKRTDFFFAKINLVTFYIVSGVFLCLRL